jgi:Ca-activated chloride channel family protein
MNFMNHARLWARDGGDAMLEGVKASGDLRGVLFEMQVEQRFRNATDKNAEVVYSFPLPWSAVLLDVDVRLGERHLSGTVVEKKQAEARYEETLSEGHAAIMLEKNHDASYSLNLGNLAAGESCVITLRYAQILQFEQRGLRLLIPTVIAPRYGDPVLDGGLQPHQAPEHSLAVEYPFDIELRLHGDLAQARVASPSHPISVRIAKDRMTTVSLSRRGALDRDFVLTLDDLAHTSAVVMAQDSVEAGCVVALASFCPRIAMQEPMTVAVKLLVDCSGSMAGDSIDAAKRALQSIVLQLDPGDRFSLSRFGSTVEHRARALWSLTDATQVAAQRWIGDLQADLGGTEMEAALKSTFALASRVSSDVLVVTDGEIDAIDSTIESARSSGHRVFAVGIGSSPAESHLRRLAEATGGACDFVAPGEAVEPAVLRMFARLRSPKLDRVSVVWPGGQQPEWMTPVQPSVFDGDTVNVFALFHKAPVGEVRLIGMRTGGDAPEMIGSAEFGRTIESAATLSRMAAQARVAAFGSEFAEEATRLSVAYQLVTAQTNYLLVHQRAEGEQAAEMPELHKVAQMIPAGWGGTGSVRLPLMSQVIAAANMDGAPRVFRSRNVVMARDADDFQSPAFLRRNAGSSLACERPSAHEADRFAYPLNPMALAKKLRLTASAQWPASYAELRQFGLDTPVVDWLELVVAAQGDPAHTEREWVAAFVFVMAHEEIRLSLAIVNKLRGTKHIVQRFIEWLAPSTGSEMPPGVDRRLAQQIVQALQGISADAWPDQVYAMSAPPASVAA